MDIQIVLPIVLLAFICEFVDSSLGMGYGTTLTPILLMMGYEPLEIVPAILFSEFITGITAGVVHHEFGNVDFRRGTRDFKVMVVLSILSIFGVLFSTLLSISLPKAMVKVYIGILVLAMGLLILFNRNKEMGFSWKRIGLLGFVAAFNKGISGGGYGPVVTGGQVLAGIRGRTAVGIASLAEGITSLVGVLVYMLAGSIIPFKLAPSLMIGAVLSVPFAAYAVKKVPAGKLTTVIGGITTLLGGYTLWQLF